MAFKVASFNVLTPGFGDLRKVAPLVECTEQIDADVIVFPEGYRAEEYSSEALEMTEIALKSLGYQVAMHAYDDKNGRPDRHGLVYASRLNGNVDFEYTGERRSAHALVIDPATLTPVNFWGVHLDDRSEMKRLEAVEDIDDVAECSIVAGDFNAMSGRFRAERLLGLRAVGLMANQIPQARARSIVARLHEMASGETIQALEAKGLREAGQAPTFPFRCPSVQLDHIMVSDDLGTWDFKASSHKQKDVSDHRSVSCTVLT